MCKSIMFPSLPVSTLYSTITLAWSDVFKLAVITESLLLKLMEFIFTMSVSSSSGTGLVSWLMLCIFTFLPLLQTSL